jgi:hypothetical protein
MIEIRILRHIADMYNAQFTIVHRRATAVLRTGTSKQAFSTAEHRLSGHRSLEDSYYKTESATCSCRVAMCSWPVCDANRYNDSE